MRYEDEFFQNAQGDETWQRYCGFLSLSTAVFCQIQCRLLQEQLGIASVLPLGQHFIPGGRVSSIDEFRKTVPLHRYADYAPFLENTEDYILGKSPQYWVHTSASRGSFKKVPWTSRFHVAQRRNIIAAFILSSAKRMGDVHVKPGARVLNLLPAKPFASASLGYGLVEQFSIRAFPPMDAGEEMTFKRKIHAAIDMGLLNNVDYAIAMTSSLVRAAQLFDRSLNQLKRNPVPALTTNAEVALRLLRPRSRKHRLPKDAWALKGIIMWGADSDALTSTIKEEWGRDPLQLYASTEGGIMAMQDWKRGPLAFLPDSVFTEFIPEEYVHSDNPPTVLMDEVKNGRVYEPVISSFYGMPFLRYRQGDLIRIVQSGAGGGEVPRMVFVSRADDTVDVFGISRLTHDVVSEALTRVGLGARGWYLNKICDSDRVLLELYVETTGDQARPELERRVGRELKAIDRHWGEATSTMAYNPIVIRPVAPGALMHLERRSNGAPWLRMNPPGDYVQELMKMSKANT